MKRLAFLKRLVLHLFRNTPLWYGSILLSIVSVLAEVAAVSSLYPLTMLATNQPPAMDQPPTSWLISLGIVPSFKNLLLVFLGFFLFRVGSNLLNQSLYLKLGRRTHAMLSSQAFEAVVKHEPIRSVEDKSAGYFITLAGDESFRTSTIIISLIQLLNYSILSLLYFFAILKLSPEVAGALIAFLGLSGLLLSSAIKRSKNLGAIQSAQSAEAGSLFLDALNGLRSVRAFSAEEYVTRAYSEKLGRYTNTLFLIDFYPQLFKSLPAAMLLVICIVFVLLLPEAKLANFNAAFVMTNVAFVLRFLPTLGSTVQTLQRLINDAKAGRDITEIVQSRGGKVSGKQQIETVDKILIEGLSFSHRNDINVLRDLNLELRRGCSYAIVGASGSGKSTLLDLILGFYQKDKGSIRLNDSELETVSSTSLRRKVILLSQNSPILNDTVAQNISYGSEASTEQLSAACRKACVDGVVAGLPLGFNTVLQYQGTNLSGGQRQRITIARALLREPDVLFLDECTSALDSETRNLVVQNILNAFRDRIVVFVTHDEYVMANVTNVIRLSKPTAT